MSNLEQRTDLRAAMPAVAKALLGDPKDKVRKGTEWRYRTRGSLSIDLSKGTWFDHEAGQGGGVIDLIRKERSCSVRDALKWLEDIGQHVPPVQPIAERQVDLSLRDAAMRIWRECIDTENTLVERYLRSRDLEIGLNVPDIRFHPDCPFGKDEAGFQRFLPAMVSLVRNPGTREPMGIHRTALNRDGKKLDRKMLGPCHGGVVMLSPVQADSSAGICEGIETGLAVIELGGGPVWACLSAGSMAKFAPIGGIQKLSIYADNDEAGLAAAQRCARQWLGIGVKAEINVPYDENGDFADTLAHRKRGDVA